MATTAGAADQRPVAIAAPTAPVTRVAADEWPPFVTAALPGDGLSGFIVGAVLERQGQRLAIDYFPWKRAVQLGLTDPSYAGFMAVWRTAEREKLCHFSTSIGSTQTVLAHLKDTALTAASLPDLRGIRIGTVAGYSNGEMFDSMAQRGELLTDEGPNDEINVKKLLMKRFSAIVIEKHVLRYLLLSKAFSKAERERVVITENMFKERPVYLCFKRDAAGLARQEAFNAAAREVDVAKIERDYWKRIIDAGAATPLNF